MHCLRILRDLQEYLKAKIYVCAQNDSEWKKGGRKR